MDKDMRSLYPHLNQHIDSFTKQKIDNFMLKVCKCKGVLLMSISYIVQSNNFINQTLIHHSVFYKVSN